MWDINLFYKINASLEKSCLLHNIASGTHVKQSMPLWYSSAVDAYSLESSCILTPAKNKSVSPRSLFKFTVLNRSQDNRLKGQMMLFEIPQ